MPSNISSISQIPLQIEIKISELLKHTHNKLDALRTLREETPDDLGFIKMRISKITTIYEMYLNRKLTGVNVDEYFFNEDKREFWESDLKPLDYEEDDMLLNLFYFKYLPDNKIPFDKIFERAYEVIYTLELRKRIEEIIEKEEYNNFQTPLQNALNEKQVLINPLIKDDLLDILCPYFKNSTRTELEEFLFVRTTKKELLFFGNANQLTDVCIKIFELEYFSTSIKEDIITWICSNFKFTDGNTVKIFTAPTTRKRLDPNDPKSLCMRPIIEFTKDGKIITK